VVACEHDLQTDSQLTLVVEALSSLCPALGLRKRRQQQGGENSDNGDDHQKFN